MNKAIVCQISSNFAYKDTIKGLYYISNGVERGFFSCNLLQNNTNYRYGFYDFSDAPHKLS